MPAGGDNQRNSVLTAACGGCGKQVRAPAVQAGKRVRCPHCGDAVRLPGAAFRAVEGPAPAVPADRLLVHCPACAASFYARKEHAGRPTKCGKCGTHFTLPRVELAAAGAVEPDAFSISPFDLDDETEGYAISTPVVQRTVTLEFPEEPRAIAERIELDAPPRSLYFSGVFGFPFRGDAASRWLSLTLLMCVLCGLSWGMLMFIGGGPGGSQFEVGLGVVGAGFMLLAAFWAFLITASFASNCAKTIVEDTAAGGDQVASWPEADWRTWFFPMVAVGYVSFLTLTIGYVLHLAVLLAPLEIQEYLNFGAFAIVPFVLFPLLMLSGLECDSMVVPLSGPVFASLWRHAGSWLGFYGLTALLACGVLLPAVVLRPFLLGLFAVLYFAVAASTGTFLYARLLGRLGWRISHAKAAQEEEEDESSEDFA
ncbi:MAG: hypothetical protein KF708_24195 [Pirellulales bacterium]|nr:hypothetical protein [Pirellulales bacterium]